MKIFLTFFFIINISNLFSQTWTATATADANVIRGVSLSLTGSGSLNYGEIFSTGSTQNFSILNQNGQKFLATGQAGRTIYINYNSSVTLSNSAWVAQYGGTSSTLTFNSNTVTRTGTNSNYVSPVNVTNGSGVVLPNLNGIGTLYLWSGGVVTIEAGKPQGDYVGTFSMSITY